MKHATSPELPSTPTFASLKEYREAFSAVCAALVRAVPELRERCCVKGTAPISILHTQHRVSWDLDLTLRGMYDRQGDLVRKMQQRLGRRLSISGDNEYGMFQGDLDLPGLPVIGVDFFAAKESILPSQIEHHPAFSGLPCYSLSAYADAKVETLGERNELKDVYDLARLANLKLPRNSVRQMLANECGLGVLARVQRQAREASATPDRGMLTAFRCATTGLRPVSAEEMAEFASQVGEVRQRKELVMQRRQEAREEARFDRQFVAPAW